MDIEDRPDLNTGTPWSEVDLRDLVSSIRVGDSVEETATFLCRSRREVREKIAELEHPASRQGGSRKLLPGLGIRGASILLRPAFPAFQQAAHIPAPTEDSFP